MAKAVWRCVECGEPQSENIEIPCVVCGCESFAARSKPKCEKCDDSGIIAEPMSNGGQDAVESRCDCEQGEKL